MPPGILPWLTEFIEEFLGGHPQEIVALRYPNARPLSHNNTFMLEFIGH
jgi:hypothetical protein